MKLAIADPPYLGVAGTWYGTGKPTHLGPSTLNGVATAPPSKADNHPEAHLWDDPTRHHQLVTELQRYDGYAIAMKPASLWHYLRWCDPSTHRVAAWGRTTALPTGSRPIASWEPVIIRVPDGRRTHTGNALNVRDWLQTLDPTKPSLQAKAIACTNGRRATFAGQKPPEWTRWVLDMLGYDPDEDTVDDLFPGSGAVTNAIAQGVLL